MGTVWDDRVFPCRNPVGDSPITTAGTTVANAVVQVGQERCDRPARRSAAAFGLVSAGLAFSVGEELSRGQRLLGLTPPEVFAHANVQHEITLHNLVGASHLVLLGCGLVGFWGALGWLLIAHLPRRDGRLASCVPQWHLAPYFLVAGATYAWWPLFERVGFRMLGIGLLRRGASFGWQDQEPAELMLVAGMVLFLIDLGREFLQPTAPPAAARCCLPPTVRRRLLHVRPFRGSLTRPAYSLSTLRRGCTCWLWRSASKVRCPWPGRQGRHLELVREISGDGETYPIREGGARQIPLSGLSD